MIEFLNNEFNHKFTHKKILLCSKLLPCKNLMKGMKEMMAYVLYQMELNKKGKTGERLTTLEGVVSIARSFLSELHEIHKSLC